MIQTPAAHDAVAGVFSWGEVKVDKVAAWLGNDPVTGYNGK